MVQAEGMALAPFGVLGSGRFKSQKNPETRGAGERMHAPVTDDVFKISAAMEKIADAKGTVITSVALAYVMHKAPYVFPIVGGRKLEHLKANIEALTLELSDEDINTIETAAPFDVGFPSKMMYQGLFFNPNRRFKSSMTVQDIPLLQMGSYLATVERPKPIKPHGLEHYDKVFGW
jgi:diketogulonate reductase-like aldo/keto reductase